MCTLHLFDDKTMLRSLSILIVKRPRMSDGNVRTGKEEYMQFSLSPPSVTGMNLAFITGCTWPKETLRSDNLLTE